jgi:IS30 family transposase
VILAAHGNEAQTKTLMVCLGNIFPKGTDLSVHSQAKLNAVARQSNERPHKTLEFETPTQRFNPCVTSTD